ncbi:MAG: beta-galactosidase [Candidatus Zixiibacteriota bacterium]
MLGVIGNKFSIGKETYAPFSAELHYFRIDKRYWSICFERIKRAGFRIIATAVPWSIHQDERKHFDFAGLSDPRKDLVVFLELAREFGFKVILRPGPAVAGQIPNEGLPSYLFSDLKMLARNSSGQEITLPSDHGVPGGYLPSYLHRNYQFHLRSFFKAFIEITKNYVHPRGPVFMVELDYETSYGRLLEPGSADYNPDVLAEFYPEFLSNRYEDIKKLNASYKEKNSGFDTVEAPRKFSDLDTKDYSKIIDWMRFREYMLNVYLENLEDLVKSYTVEPLIFRSLYFRSGDLIPAFNLVPEDRLPFLGSNLFPSGSYFDLAAKARFLREEYGFGFATSFISGGAAADPEREAAAAPVGNNVRRFYLSAGLSAGFKGLNHYMFVDREYWYGAPLHKDGTVSDGYDVIRHFNTTVQELGLEDMEASPEVAVLGNRLYYWLQETQSKNHFSYLGRLLNDTTMGLCRDLMRLKLRWGIRENRDMASLSKYKLLVVASAEVMSESDQEALVSLVKAGTSIVMCGVMPRYNEHFKDCQILANHFRIKTNIDCHIGIVEHKHGSFPTHIYGSIRSTDESKVKKLVKCNSKVVGVSSSRFKGTLYFFSFDLASGGNHHKLSFIESILAHEKLDSSLYCSDPSVDVSFQMTSKKGLLFIVAPPPGELSDGLDAGKREVIVRADLKQLGFKAAKLKLTNLFDDPEEAQPLKLTAKELRDGISLEVNFPDGIAYLVEKRH